MTHQLIKFMSSLENGKRFYALPLDKIDNMDLFKSISSSIVGLNNKIYITDNFLYIIADSCRHSEAKEIKVKINY